MGMFFNPMKKPCGFKHQYLNVDERKENIAQMEEKAKHELGMLPEKERTLEDIRGTFIEGTTHLKRRKQSRQKPVAFGILLLIIAFLLFLWHYLLTGN